MTPAAGPATRTATAVVTGLGIVAPGGIGVEEYWSAMLRGHSAIGPITRFDASGYPVRLAGEVSGFRTEERIPSRLAVQTDRWTHLGLAAAEAALADAGADPHALAEVSGLSGISEYDMAVVTASSSGGTEFGQREIERLWSRGPRHVGAYQSIAWFYAATTGQISIRHGMRGPCGVIAAEQAGALDALAHARRVVRDGARLVVSGGTDASLCPYGLVAQLSTGRLSTRQDPARAYVPFDAEACGHLPGEGGAMLIVEDARSARRRGAAHAYGEIAGHAATFDPPPGSGREPGLRRAVMNALMDARTAPEEIDVVFADAAAVPALDRAEADALAWVFEPYGVPVTAPKTLTGRLYAGVALDVATALLAIRDDVIPPTAAGVTQHPDHRIDLVVGEPRPGPVRAALVVARGFGGMNAALVLRRTDPRG
ncbi:ketosynthase chain-length factor [Streptomyces sp. ME19-01-6]|uniref:ketosynthase chain-length factor n=1 Tax=Streptomyces sp. ME19-01-6 TaxID=3028686 RepID=UPI0029A771FD|nr:ketosynthase chain-length factor [Streptomyces sp. ME19-01-6]MDX3227796.1 ketosynthase chain-length factor [Streptomyces sp. ME19-01-6]